MWMTFESLFGPVDYPQENPKQSMNFRKYLLINTMGKFAAHLLEELPGVVHKNASVVVSQAFCIHAFPVDTHIHRLLKRWGITKGKNVVQTENDAKKVFPKNIWNKLHLQIIFYGREYSPARSPKYEIDFITRQIGTKAAIMELK